MIHSTIVCSVVIVVLALAVLAASSPWLRRIHSVRAQNGIVVIETSPDGRLSNPYRTELFVSFGNFAIACALFLIAFVTMAAVLCYVAMSAVRFGAS